VEDGRRIISSVVASQVGVHAKYGGIFPEAASRMHIEAILPVVQEAGQGPRRVGGSTPSPSPRPGWPGACRRAGAQRRVGVGQLLIGINHLEASVLDLAGGKRPRPAFPMLGLIVGGPPIGLMQDHLTYQRLKPSTPPATFDKSDACSASACRRAAIQQEARQKPEAIVPRLVGGTWDFSFSGLRRRPA
jgi:N6-L-threonylcarbamoyladenine synthase